MAGRARSSFGFFGLFGRSSDLRMLDAGLRAADLHPALVPEGVKMTIVNLMKDHGVAGDEDAYSPAAHLFAFCVMGDEAFARVHGAAAAEALDRRIEAALARGAGLDADIVQLAYHAGLISGEIIARHGIEVETGGEESG